MIRPTAAFLALFLVNSPSVTTAAVFQEGDTCGITSAKFLQEDFVGEYLVAGQKACTLGSKENCYCAPNYEGDRLSEWIWQCSGDDSASSKVAFGPIQGKTCPTEVPVQKQNVIVDDSIDCDTSLHPTGVQADPVCSYSTCDQGGDTSSICACIDKEAYGLGEGTQWVCLHSTCSCGEQTEVAAGATSGAANFGNAILPFLAAGAVLGL